MRDIASILVHSPKHCDACPLSFGYWPQARKSRLRIQKSEAEAAMPIQPDIGTDSIVLKYQLGLGHPQKMKRLGQGNLLQRLHRWPAVASLGLLSLTTMIAGVAFAEMPRSGIQGKALLGPTCPVMRIGQDCGAQPYQARLAILNEWGDVVSCIETKADGSFTVNLPPGHYRIQSGTEIGSPPFLKEQPSLTVTPNQVTDITLHFDSGIR